MNDLSAEFRRHQQNGYLGDPTGEDAYAYGRASTEKQVEEGGSFPRQIENIHKAAVRDKLRITFDMLFFDDGYSGFEFEHRPALTKLREEVAAQPRAKHIVFEDIDRLSRDADWQQGFLLGEFAQRRVLPHFYINPGSQLERYVRGYIAQEGMRKDLERMKQGNLTKAKSGRVTARRPRYGYVITDPKQSQYELHPEESRIVRMMFTKIIYEGASLKTLARWLNDSKIPTRFKGGTWDGGTLLDLINCPVYKGEFYANKYLNIKTGKFKKNGKPALRQLIRPESEWIKIAVPAIVTPEEWAQAQECLKRNSKLSLRNGKRRRWLLQGLLKCDSCKNYSFVSISSKGTRSRLINRYYACNSAASEKARMENKVCAVPYVSADQLEARVWEKVVEVIYDPSVIIQRLEAKLTEEEMMGLQSQIDYIDAELEKITKERNKLEAAYNRDIYTLDEFETKMKDLKDQVQSKEVARAKIEAKQAETHAIEEKKRVVLAALSQLRQKIDTARSQGRLPEEIPFELKRHILTLLVETIWVNSVARTFTIDGEIKGTYAIDEEKDTPISGGDNGGFELTSGRKRSWSWASFAAAKA